MHTPNTLPPNGPINVGDVEVEHDGWRYRRTEDGWWCCYPGAMTRWVHVEDPALLVTLANLAKRRLPSVGDSIRVRTAAGGEWCGRVVGQGIGRMALMISDGVSDPRPLKLRCDEQGWYAQE